MKKYYRVFAIVLAVAMICSFAACGGSSTESKAPESTTPSSAAPAPADSVTPAPESKDIKIGPMLVAGGSSGGNGFVTASTLVERVKASYPDAAIDVVPGGTAGNILKLWQGEADLIFATTSTMMKANKGLPFSAECDEPVDKLLAIADIWNQYFQFTVPADFPYDCIDDVIKEKYPFRICPGGPKGNTGCDAFAEYLDVCYGLTFDDLEAWGCTVVYCDFNDATQMIKDGQLDMFTPLTAAPSAAIMELALTTDLKWMTISEESADKLADYGYVTAYMSKEHYNGMTEDVFTLSLPYGIGASSDLSEDVVYVFTKTLCENEQYMKDSISAMRDYVPNQSFQQMGFDLHPGAAKYYKEMGWIS